MFKKLVLTITAAALLIGLTACGTNGKPSSDPAPVTKTVTSAPAKPAPAQNATFGNSYKWDDGLSVSISAPAPYTPTPEAAGMVTGDSNIVFTIAVTNNTQENIDASVAQFNLTSGGVAASAVADLSGPAGTGFGPQTPILPGQTVSWQSAWSVKDVSDMTAQFNIEDFTHKAAIFTN